MPVTLLLFGLLLGLAIGLATSVLHRRWQALHARERFLLGMKQMSTPALMTEEETQRLRLLRTPWWALSVWLRDLWHGRSQPPRPSPASISQPPMKAPPEAKPSQAIALQPQRLGEPQRMAQHSSRRRRRQELHGH